MLQIFSSRLLQCTVLLMLQFISMAARVDTLLVTSKSMNKEIKVVAILPENYSNAKKYPVVYLLHGYSGNHADWISKAPVVKSLCDQHQLIVICPDGKNSWYWDSPSDPTYRYETFVSSELVNWVDSHFSTIASKKGRGITGLSMGGHGGLYLGLKHSDVFGVAGSMSGGVDIRPFPNNWEMEKHLGSYAEFPDRWEKNSVVNLLHLYKPGSLSIIVDCGTEDFFYSARLHCSAWSPQLALLEQCGAIPVVVYEEVF
jgi:S-formylglutathione hydrolase FrmB